MQTLLFRDEALTHHQVLERNVALLRLSQETVEDLRRDALLRAQGLGQCLIRT